MNVMKSPKGKNKKQLRKQVIALQTAFTNENEVSIQRGQAIRNIESQLKKAQNKIAFLENTTVGGLLQYGQTDETCEDEDDGRMFYDGSPTELPSLEQFKKDMTINTKETNK